MKRLRTWLDSVREWLRRSGDPHYAYLVGATDIVDLEYRLKNLERRRAVNITAWGIY